MKLLQCTTALSLSLRSGGLFDPILAIQPQPVSRASEAVEFRSFDVDHDGYITSQDMDAFFADANPYPGKAKITKIFRKIDLDDNGVITWQEFSTPLDAEFFDFLLRTKNKVNTREIELVEDEYMREFGNPYKEMRSLPPAEYNMQGEEIRKPTKGEKYLPNYGWFRGGSPAIDALYKGQIQDNPDPHAGDDEESRNYHYSFDR